ncbi:MAG TPA: hypothetical protein VMG74_00780 [Gaiellaceae bacterium]|nr:hypothetical protein [Gaiellaceae bacterium]
MLRGITRYLQRHHIALLALFLALGGTSFAAASFINGKQIKPGSLPKNRLTKSAIKSLKGNKGVQGVPGQRGPTGAQGVAGPGARWAAVSPTGTIVLQSGGIAVSHPGTGIYIVNFGADVSKDLVLLTPGTVADGSFRGTAVGSSCAAPATTASLTGCPTTNAQNFVFVGELNSGDTAVGNHGFYVAVVGPAGTASPTPVRPTAGGGFTNH